VKHLGHPKKFARVTGAVSGLPAPPVRSGIPVKARPRACACVPVPACLPTRFQQCTKLLASRGSGNGKQLAARKGLTSVFLRQRCATIQMTPRIALRCFAMLCNAMRCAALRCSALRCRAVQCAALRCTALLCFALQCAAMPCNARQRARS
jgi:hypothetical protein